MTTATTTTVGRVEGLAVPFNVPILVGDRGLDGKLVIARETIDDRSFPTLPPKVPLQRRHDTDNPIGWADIRQTARGIELTSSLIDSPTARDTMAAIAAGLLSGLSITFSPSDRDQWSLPKGGTIPWVLRRGATLQSVAVVAKPAYREAYVRLAGDSQLPADGTTDRGWGPYQDLLEAKLAEAKRQRDSDLALLAELGADHRRREAEAAEQQAAAAAAQPWRVPAPYAGGDVLEYLVPRDRCATLAAAEETIAWLAFPGASVSRLPGDIDSRLHANGIATIRRNNP